MKILIESNDGLIEPSSSIIPEATSNIAKYQSERPIGVQETARLWRHTKREGLELFRGSYIKYKAARHYHTNPAIGVVDRGAMTSYYRGSTHVLPTRTVFLINPGEVHAPGPAKAPGWVLRVFYFEKNFYKRLSSNFGRDPLRFDQVFVKDQKLSSSLLKLHHAMESSVDSLEIDSALVSIFGRIAERYACNCMDASVLSGEKTKINRVRQYIEANYLKNHTLEELSGVAQLSPYYLLRAFQKTVGLTPRAYLNQIRIEIAMQLLREGKAISQAAFDTGFADQSHFTRNFKLMMGVTPGQFHARICTRAIGVQA